jgi:hypothetical protein
MSNWQYLAPMGVGQQGSTNQAGGGGLGLPVPPGYRDALDAARSAVPAIPSAAYPDGYLGTITDRHEDKLFASVQGKLTDRSYQRGVHVGSRVDPQDYFWPKEFGPQTGLQMEAKGRRFNPPGTETERLAHMGKNAITSPAEMGRIARKYGVDPGLRNDDPAKAASLQRFRPPWM